MPWRTQTVMDERARFVFEAERSHLSFAELCRRHGISRPTGYKWLDRHRAAGLEGLRDRSHRPRGCPHRIPADVEQRIVELRRRRTWGAPKLRTLLEKELGWAPAVSTIHRILKRHDLVRSRKPRRRRENPGPSPLKAEAPNDLWTADFKGQFRTGDGELCYPLTVQDAHSRFLLDCRGLRAPTLEGSKATLLRLFRRHGLPRRIRTDNGTPFASSVSIGRLTQLSAWWLDLGITPDFIQPGKPQQNGRHERMHRTLKREATRPPRAKLRSQQQAFNTFRRVFNEERPHQALDQRTPADLYEPSTRPLPTGPVEYEYPAHFEVRLVSQVNNIRWKARFVFVSSVLKGRRVGLEEVGDGLWAVSYGPYPLGWLDEKDYRIMDVQGPRRRR